MTLLMVRRILPRTIERSRGFFWLDRLIVNAP
jgi:hypothetical protein